MFLVTRDPSSGSFIQHLAKIKVMGLLCHANRHDRTITLILAKCCIKFPDDGSLVIRKMLEQF